MKSSEVSIKTRSTPASLSFKGQVTKHTTVRWSITTQQTLEGLRKRKRHLKTSDYFVITSSCHPL